ncbi:chitinase-3-like protein 1 [Achroia grisella]|uniref:chitinase-3-like protein 1 n=1 Tax=Achroia grisella TaxID=688607 RepID=UPI0027D2CA29|nr:chitinase-3-like protein 1 [Achroia grisella]
MNKNNIIILLLFAFSANNVVFSEKLFLCYYGSWASYSSGLGKLEVEDINTELCTHLIYSFVGINNQGTVISLDPRLDYAENNGRDNFRRFNALKLRNPKLKTILAVGGWSEGSAKYSIMAASPNFRRNFIESALKLVLDYGFDGFDIDWEYPNRRDTVNGRADINNFTQLLKEIKEVFIQYGLLVTAAVSSVGHMAVLSYDIPAISQYLDIVSVMTYDMYGAWNTVTGHNAPLHKGEGDEGAVKETLFTVDVAIEYWLREGCPREKLVLGLPLYGRTFTLANANVNSVRAPSVGPGIGGPFTVTSGFMGYNEYCILHQTQPWDVRYDSLAKVPYAIQGRNWLSFDNADSLTTKVEYALDLNLAGVMVWSIDTDDRHGVCGDGELPLLRAINKALASAEDITPENTSTTSPPSTPALSSTSASSSTPATSTTPSTIPTSPSPSTTVSYTSTTTTRSTTTTAPNTSVCKSEGFAADPESCTSFFICVDVNGVLEPKRFQCPGNLVWDQQSVSCNYQHIVNCTL